MYFSQYDVDEQGEFNSKDELEVGANYILTFPQKSMIPFIKAGLGIGRADTELLIISRSGELTDNIYNLHLNLGGGLSYALTDNVAITGGIEYVYRKWEDLESSYTTLGITDSIFRFGVGIDVNF